MFKILLEKNVWFSQCKVERINMTQQEMYDLIHREDKRIQANKAKRNLKFFFGIAAIFFIISISWFKNDILDSLLFGLLGSGLYVFSGILFWLPFIHANDKENNHLEEMKKEYQKKYNETWY